MSEDIYIKASFDVAEFTDALVKFWGNVVDAYADVVPSKVAFQEYVNVLNWKRPRGRKLSWRSLNRIQRHQAVATYLVKRGIAKRIEDNANN